MKGQDNITFGAIEPRIATYIIDRNLYVLRDKKTGNALNVSYSEDGLKWTTSPTGKLLYYKNGKITRTMDMKKFNMTGEFAINGVSIESDDGKDLIVSDKVYVEKFIPKNRPTLKGQVAEYTWVGKGFRLLILNAPSFEA